MMGMVFVASMFPVGLHNSRKNVDQTINAIESHNAAVMAELMIESTGRMDIGLMNTFSISSPEDILYDYTLNEYNYGNASVGTSVNEVHFIPRPNILAGSGNAIIADFEFEFDISGNPYNLTGVAYSDLKGMLSATNYVPPFSCFATHFDSYDKTRTISIIDDYFVNYGMISFDSILNCILYEKILTGDIGRICCPVADESDPDVLEMVKRATGGVVPDFAIYANRLNYLYPAIYQISLQRKYTWAAAYKERDDQDAPFELSVFILKQGGDNARYAVQNPLWAKLAYPAEPYYPYHHSELGLREINFEKMYMGGGYDCRFPVPWLIYLDKPVISSNILGSVNDDGTFFYVNSDISRLLRPGSVILDADPQYVKGTYTQPTFNVNSGKMLRIRKIELEAAGAYAGQYKVTLASSISDAGQPNSLFAFWVFPPAIIRDGDEIEFLDEQPVVDVIQKPYWYKK